MTKVVCIGSVNVDNLLYVEEFCSNDQEKKITNLQICSGGSAANIAAGLGRLGKKVYFFGNLGKDAHTLMLTNDFDKDNVDYSFAVKTENPNNTVYAVVDKNGSRRMYAYNNVQLTANDFPDALLEDTEIIIFTSLIKDKIIDVYTEIAARAKNKGIKIALDPGNIFAQLGLDTLRPLLEKCDYFFPSLSEVEMLVGNIDNVPQLGVPKVIVTCGEKGTVYFNNNTKKEFPLKTLPGPTVDTTGAGDCFDAAFLAQLLEGKSDEEAIQFAMIASNLSVKKKGGRSIPTQDEIKYREDKGSDTLIYDYVIAPGTNEKFTPAILRTARAKKPRWRNYRMLNANVVDAVTGKSLSGVKVLRSNSERKTDRSGKFSQRISSGADNWLVFTKDGYTFVGSNMGAGEWTVRLPPKDLANKGKKSYANPWLRKFQTDFFRALHNIGQTHAMFSGMWKTKDRGDVYLANHTDAVIHKYTPVVPKQIYLDFALDCLRANANVDIGGQDITPDGPANNNLEMRIVNNKYIQLQTTGTRNSKPIYFPKSILHSK